MKKLLLLLTLIFSLQSVSYAEKIFYCQVELATGLVSKGNGNYKEAPFELNRYTMVFDDNFKLLKGFDVVKGLGDYKCRTPYPNQQNMKHISHCTHESGYTFTINSITKRFVYVQSGAFGFTNLKDDDSNSIAAGTCVNF